MIICKIYSLLFHNKLSLIYPTTKFPDCFSTTDPVLDIKFVPDDFQIIMMEGQNKVITCEARGNPTPTYKWEFQPQNSVNPTIFQSQKLNLNSVRLEQTGKYTCIASNNIRNDTYNMTKTLTVNIGEYIFQFLHLYKILVSSAISNNPVFLRYYFILSRSQIWHHNCSAHFVLPFCLHKFL